MVKRSNGEIYLFLSFILYTAGIAHHGTYAAESDVGTGLVLILIGAPCGTNHAFGVFPRAAAHALFLQAVGVFLGGVVAELRVHVAHGLNASFSIHRAGPFCHVACHVIESVGVC